VRERHNERKNESYYNADIIPKRSGLNVYYQMHIHNDGAQASYQKTFDSMLKNGTIVKRGLKENAKVFDELIFDVNSAYFEENGGYEFAKDFFEEAYNLAVKEVGAEYIISAVMHADEKNIALSEKLGRDVYHYHLHVVYVPVVQKEVRWSKRCKDPALIGTVKEIIPQISHSKKWPKLKGENRKWVNSYSLLQDRFYEHMKAAGFEGFERGERGSTAEHLSVLDYKIKQDKKRLEDTALQVNQKRKEVNFLVEATKVRNDISATHDEIDNMTRSNKSGDKQIISNPDWKRVSEMAKRCVLLDSKIKDLRKEIDSLKNQVQIYKSRWELLNQKAEIFIKAFARSPRKVKEFLENTMFQLPEKSELEQRQNKLKSEVR